MTDDVNDLVLDDNYRQNDVMGISRSHAGPMVSVHARLVAALDLDRELEALPSKEEFAELGKAKKGLTSPELATVLAHVKLQLKHELLDSDLPDQTVFARRLPDYFPTAMRERFAEPILAHPLAREIVTTQLVNEVVDYAGISYAFRLSEEMNATATDAVRAFTVVSRVFDLPSIWAQIDALDNVVPTAVADGMALDTRRLLDRAARWWLQTRPQPLAVGAEISRFRPIVEELMGKVAGFVQGSQAQALQARREKLLADGVPERLADDMASLLDGYGLLDVADVTELADRETDHGEHTQAETAELYFALSEHLNVDKMLVSVTALERGNRWHALARLALRDDMYHALRGITLDALRYCDPEDSVEVKIGKWEKANSAQLARARASMDDIARSGRLDLATLSVAARQLRSMAG